MQNKMNGQGRISDTHGELYIGEVRDDLRHGRGMLTTRAGKKTIGLWAEDVLVAGSDCSGEKY